MKPFIRVDQYQFIKAQTQVLINGHSTSSDADVLKGLKEIALERVLDLFEDIEEEQVRLLEPLLEIKDGAQAKQYLSNIFPYVVPFKLVTEQVAKRLFPKQKKLKLASLNEEELKEITYLAWHDKGSNKTFIIAPYHNKLVGLQGTFHGNSQKGICSICNKHEEVGLFISERKGEVQGTFVKRGNYICKDSISCNHQLTSLDKLYGFIEQLKF